MRALILVASGFGLALHNVSIVEFLWFLFGVIGFYFARSNYRKALADLAYVRAEVHDPAVSLLAGGHIRTEINRMLIHGVVMFTGVLAMLTPPATKQPVTVVGLIITFALFFITIITISQSVLDRRLRSALEEEGKQREEPHDV